uniref:AlNc14C254G9685 protein n=1 Tax=Albugo laibachii Nc14 TaxID=890382 RepID=F0WTK6_9STRA|nr:AlNc14C254G9685 [Albugo laibachii Nc14]|eukprot:CCA24697.1 AlNc14C254G9685 [Albugo laibachii Nc14]
MAIYWQWLVSISPVNIVQKILIVRMPLDITIKKCRILLSDEKALAYCIKKDLSDALLFVVIAALEAVGF